MDPRLVASSAVTREIVRKFRERAGAIPIVAFTVDAEEPYTSEFRKIFAAAGIPLIEEPQAAVARRETAGESMRGPDRTHWNAAGHRVVAEVLDSKLRE